MSAKLKIYEYSGCSTCRKALKFLDARRVSYQKIPILETQPSEAELRAMLRHVGGDIRKLFNTSGQAYREMGMSEKLKAMDEKQALRLLARNGRLVKRPFAIMMAGPGAPGCGVLGFREPEWKRLADS